MENLCVSEINISFLTCKCFTYIYVYLWQSWTLVPCCDHTNLYPYAMSTSYQCPLHTNVHFIPIGCIWNCRLLLTSLTWKLWNYWGVTLIWKWCFNKCQLLGHSRKYCMHFVKYFHCLQETLWFHLICIVIIFVC